MWKILTCWNWGGKCYWPVLDIPTVMRSAYPKQMCPNPCRCRTQAEARLHGVTACLLFATSDGNKYSRNSWGLS